LNEIPIPTYNTPTSYDELRTRNRQEYDRTQPNKPIYRLVIILLVAVLLNVIIEFLCNPNKCIHTYTLYGISLMKILEKLKKYYLNCI